MSDGEGTVRQRATKSTSATSSSPLTDLTPASSTKSATSAPRSPTQLTRDEDDAAFSLVDIARSVVFLLLLSSAVSWFVTGDSLVWNVQRPAWANWKSVKTWMDGPLQLTDADLRKYDGTDESLPLYLAINGTIYDVSAGRRHYGPGGSYHFFAGADASRAFVTNCFETDITPDMRGVEGMFLPADDPAVDSLYTSGQLKALREQERRRARKQVHDALAHWTDFFAKSPKYPAVGTVQRAPGWEIEGPVPELCEQAKERRPTRQPPA